MVLFVLSIAWINLELLQTDAEGCLTFATAFKNAKLFDAMLISCRTEYRTALETAFSGVGVVWDVSNSFEHYSIDEHSWA